MTRASYHRVRILSPVEAKAKDTCYLHCDASKNGPRPGEANLVANMAPTWPPDGVQVGPKSTKIEPILERLLRRVFGDFGGPVHVYWTSSRSVLRRIGVGYYELLPSDELRIWSFSYTSLCEIASGS